MKFAVEGYADNQPIPTDLCFCDICPEEHVKQVENLSPAMSWSDLPAGTQSLALVCVDTDVPSEGDNVNQEGKTVSKDLPRVKFYHWVMANIPAKDASFAKGELASGITPKGKQNPNGPAGAVHGLNDYTNWFAGDPDMGGNYYGYDGPCPPWNDELVHHYHFVLYALDSELSLEGDFTGSDLEEAIQGHVLAEARTTGTYTLNPNLR